MTGQFLRFVVVGSIGFVVDAGGTWLLAHLGLSPIVARVPALVTAMVVTWLLNRKHTYRVDKPKSGSELARYMTVAATSAFLNFCLYSGLVLTGLHPVLAVAIATVTLLVFSFYAYRQVAFR